MGKSAEEILANKNGQTIQEYNLDQFETWSNALTALSLSKSYEISNGQGSNRRLTRSNLAEVKKMYDFWKYKVENPNASSNPNAPKFYTIQTAGSC